MTLERARMLMDLDRPGQAREVLHQMLSLDPHDPGALCMLAQTHLAENDADAALDAASAAVRWAPGEEWPLRLCALALAQCGRAREARDYAERAVELDPTSWRVHLTRAQVDLGRTGTADLVTLEAATQAVRLAPDEPTALRVLGSTQLALRMNDDAGRTLQRAASLAPQDAAIRNELARVDVRRRHLGRAAAGFADAAMLDPTDSIASDNIVVVGARALRVLHVILWLAVIVGIHVDQSDEHPDRTVLAASWVVALLVIAGFAAYLWQESRPRTAVLLRVIARRNRLLLAWFAALVAAFVAFAVAAFGPRSSVSDALSSSLGAIIVGMALSWMRTARLRGPGRRR